MWRPRESKTLTSHLSLRFNPHSTFHSTFHTTSRFSLRLTPQPSSRPAFTIVELLIVIVVIGILAAISIVAYNGIQNRAIDTTTKNDVTQAAKQLEISKIESGNYPASASEANDNKGLAKSDTTEYIYTNSGEDYQLTGYTDRNNSKAFCITSQNKSVREGACPGHSVPVAGGGTSETAASCFTFDAGTGTITDYDLPSTYQEVTYRDSPNSIVLASHSEESKPVKLANTDGASCPVDVSIPSKINGVDVVNIESGAFRWRGLTSVTIPSSVTSIGSYAFESNELTSVTIPSSVTSIEAGVFYDNRLTSLTIPGSMFSIGEYAFHGNKLTSLALEGSVAIVGNSAFSQNPITSLTIGSSVTSIGSYAFYYNQLTNVTIPSTVASIGQGAFFENTGINCRLPNVTSYNPLSPNIHCATIERY